VKIVPLDRSHVKGAAALHPNGVVWFYRGPADRAVLEWFYDAYANRDFTLGAAAVEGRDVLAAAVACTDLEGAAAWLLSRRRCRSAAARRRGGPEMTRGGIPVGVFTGVTGAGGKAAFFISAVLRRDVAPAVSGDLLKYLAAAAASRGATTLYAPGQGASAELASFGFERRDDLWVKLL
jgi:hypothetical protein